MCNHHHTLRDPSAWSALPLVGVQEVADGPHLELRNCACGSTLSREICEDCDSTIAPDTACPCRRCDTCDDEGVVEQYVGSQAGLESPRTKEVTCPDCGPEPD